MFNESLLERIRHNLAENYSSPTGIAIPVGVSNRHVHLSQQDIETLFGAGYQLTPCKELRQPGQFAAKECVMIVGPKARSPRCGCWGQHVIALSWKSPRRTALPWG